MMPFTTRITQVHWIALKLILLKAAILLCPHATADNLSTNSSSTLSNVEVSYQYAGDKFQVKGTKIDKNTFLFNAGAEKKVSLTTLDWAPYVGKEICKQGWVQQLTVALLASQGYEVRVGFYPWARTISNAERGLSDILFPEYFIEPSAPSDVIKNTKRLDHLALSDPIPGGPIALLKRKDFKTPFQGDLLALKGERIGVVRGYQNTPEFDALMDNNFFHIDKSVNDMMNTIKLYKNRVNYIVGDPSVIFFSVRTNTSISHSMRNGILNTIEAITPSLKYNHLYYAISKKNPEWRLLLKTINQAIRVFDQAGETSRIIESTKAHCNQIQ